MPNSDTFLSRTVGARAAGTATGLEKEGLTMPPPSTPFTEARTVENPILATHPGIPVEAIESGNVWDFAGVKGRLL